LLKLINPTFQESISDSKLALANNYPEDLKYKVYQRMATCYRMLGEKDLAAEHYQKCCKLIKEKLHDTQKKTALASAKNDYECGIQPKVKNVRLTYSKVPEVSYRVHPKMPGVTSALELRENSKLGFHFVTKRTLNPGNLYSLKRFKTILNNIVLSFYCLFYFPLFVAGYS